MSRFFGNFNGLADIEREFDVNLTIDESQIIAAGYWYESYEGQACVIYRDDAGRVFEVEAGHCSCYGLEGTWKPELASIVELQQRFSQARLPYMVPQEFANAVLAGLPPIVEE